MTSIIKGLVVLFAVVSVSLTGTQVAAVHKQIQQAPTTSQPAADATTDPVGTDAFTMKGRTRVTVIPAPVADVPAPVADVPGDVILAQPDDDGYNWRQP